MHNQSEMQFVTIANSKSFISFMKERTIEIEEKGVLNVDNILYIPPKGYIARVIKIMDNKITLWINTQYFREANLKKGTKLLIANNA